MKAYMIVHKPRGYLDFEVDGEQLPYKGHTGAARLAIETGMPACVSLDAFPAPRCNSKVRRIAPYVLDREKQARTVEIEVEFNDAADHQGLLPGYSADVEVVLERRDGVLRVPTEAVLEDSHVLVYGSGDGILERRQFKAGISN